MEIKILRSPTDEDWLLVKRCALVTVGKKPVGVPGGRWRAAILRARHSPIRELRFVFELTGIPYYVSTHLARHVHAQPYIRSQRNDRQDSYDRTRAPQDAPVDMIWSMNAEELITVAEKRLCLQADPTTRSVVQQMCSQVLLRCPEFVGLLSPACHYDHTMCREMYPCYLNKEEEQK